MAKQVAFNIKLNVDGKEVVGQVTSNVNDMRKAWDNSASSMKKFTDGLFSINNAVYALKNVAGMLDGLTGAFRRQQEAEQQLENSMRNMMDATDDEIQAIKDYCAAQQQIGVVGDEVQLAGAKELAMHLQNKDALQQLIPVMNDLLVHQRGLNVSMEDAQSVGARLGKVLDGNIGLMGRMGFTVTDAQKALFEYGDEADKVAVLAEVIEAKVGGMNEQLAQTEAGHAKQLENEFGDLEEEVGSVMSSIQGFITVVGNIAFAVTGIITVVKAFQALKLATVASTIATKAWAGIMKAGQAIMLVYRGLLSFITTGYWSTAAGAGAAATATSAFAVALRGVLTATGVGAVLMIIGALLGELADLISGTDDAMGEFADNTVQNTDAIAQANEHMKEVQSETFGELMTSFTKLKTEWAALRTEGEKTEWIQKHASELDNLGASSRDVTSVEQFFKADTANVVKAFQARAKAAALMAKMQDLYSQKLKLQDEYVQASNRLQATNQQRVQAYYDRHKVRAGQYVTDEMIRKYNLDPNRYNSRGINVGGIGSENSARGLTTADADLINQKEWAYALTMGGTTMSSEMLVILGRQNKLNEEIATTSKEYDGLAKEIGAHPLAGGGGGRSGRGGRGGRSGGGHSGGGHSGGGGSSHEELKLIANPQTEAQYQNNIRYYQEKMTADLGQAQYNAYYQAEQEQRKGLEALLKKRKEAEYVQNPQSIEDYTKNIQLVESMLSAAPDDKYSEYADQLEELRKGYVQFRLDRAKSGEDRMSLDDYDTMSQLLEEAKGYATTSEEIKNYNEQLEQIRRQKFELENADIASKNAEEGLALDAETKSFEDLDRRISYHQQMLNQADEASRAFHSGELTRLQKLRQEWEQALMASVETDASKLRTLEEIDAAVAKLQQDEQKASASEIEGIEEQLKLLEKRRQTLMAGATIHNAEDELGKINSLSGKDRGEALKEIGFQGFTDKIKELRTFLAETNDLTDEQKTRVESLIEAYQGMQHELVNTFDTYREGWNSIQGIGDGIQGLTDALDENKNAWETITGVINSLLQIYDGIMGIIQLVNLFTQTSGLAAKEKTKEAAATQAAAGAQTAETAAVIAGTAALVPEIATTKMMTRAEMQLAAAKNFAANAGSIAGAVKAAVLTATMLASVESMNAVALAKGGLVSGPTFALVGEYAGASNNPEVVAPLDKLRNMLYTPNDGRVEFRLKGEDIVGAVSNYTRIGRRSGRRSNIAL